MNPGPIGRSGIHVHPSEAVAPDGGAVEREAARVEVDPGVATEAVVEWIKEQEDLPARLEFDLGTSGASAGAIAEAAAVRGIDAEFL